MEKNCKNCNKSEIIYKSGNNDILSLILVKYSLLEINCFLKIIYQIMIKERNYDFEYCEEFNFTFNEKTYSFQEYLIFIIKKIENINNEDQNEYYLLLKSLFIISIIIDSRVKLFIFGDHDKLKKISNPFNKKINFESFIFQCQKIIEDYKNNFIQLNDIGFNSTNEWLDFGFYCI